MTTALPAHLQALQLPSLAQRAAEGIGSSLPPHISIQGNQFTLIDSAGNEEPVQSTFLDVCIVDISDVMCKMYFGAKWTPDSKDPPLCFSMNGIAPSTEAVQPQARTCSECPNNSRGSATSAVSGAAIKACRDEKKFALLVIGYPKEMLWQFTLTPGSFTNWRGYVEKFKGQPFDIRDLVTRLSFERGKSGVLAFEPRPFVQGGPAPWIDEPTTAIVLKALTPSQAGLKATDIIVGRTDRPREGGLPAPAVQPQLTAPAQVQQPAPFSPAPTAGTSSPPTTAGQFAGQAPPVESPQPAKRRRRTQAEIAADNAAAQNQPPTGAAQSNQPQGFQPAPFRPDPRVAGVGSAVEPAPNPTPFGIGQGAAPPNDLAQTLDSLFGPAPGAQ